MWSSFAYHEPTTASILILLSFLYLLNLFGWAAQATLGAGLLGQILIGIIYGTPLAGWLPDTWEDAFVSLGYVGLLLIVFEGGMQSSISQLGSILPIAICVALTGILAPIGLSFILVPLASFPVTHAFAAGSSLASTSLGTVLSVLQPAAIGFDLRRSKIGAILLSAAIMDDVVAFILAKVLTVIGEDRSSKELGANIGRALGVTIGLGIMWLLITRYALKPFYDRLQRRAHVWRNKQWGGEGLLLFFDALVFIGLVAAAGYAGTSPLFGAYIAGLSLAYLCGRETDKQAEKTPDMQREEVAEATPVEQECVASGITAFEHYISPILKLLLLPIFFASIGYSIPFVPLWRGRIIWRGIVYALLMTVGKLLCGLWVLGKGRVRAAAFLGLAMVARGEIGLLIAQIARHTQSPLLNEDEFLIVICGVMICTIIGPVGVGLTIRRWGRRVLEGGMD